MSFGPPDGDYSGSIGCGLGSDDEQNSRLVPPEGHYALFAILEPVIDPGLGIGIFESGNAIRQRKSMLSPVLGILGRVPFIVHVGSIRLRRSLRYLI
jgi:hypothetical protein